MKCVSWILDITQWFKAFTDLTGKHSLVARPSLVTKQLRVTQAARPSSLFWPSLYLNSQVHTLTSAYTHSRNQKTYIFKSVFISIEYCSILLRSTAKNVCPKLNTLFNKNCLVCLCLFLCFGIVFLVGGLFFTLNIEMYYTS